MCQGGILRDCWCLGNHFDILSILWDVCSYVHSSLLLRCSFVHIMLGVTVAFFLAADLAIVRHSLLALSESSQLQIASPTAGQRMLKPLASI